MHSHPESIAVFLTDAGHKRERWNSTAHGRLYPPAGEYKQNAIRGNRSGVEGLTFSGSIVAIGAGVGFLSLLFSRHLIPVRQSKCFTHPSAYHPKPANSYHLKTGQRE
jgi:hypothetical protein